MQSGGHTLLKNVVIAEHELGKLWQYEHRENCPRKAGQFSEKCSCGAERQNERLQDIKKLLETQYLVDFKN